MDLSQATKVKRLFLSSFFFRTLLVHMYLTDLYTIYSASVFFFQQRQSMADQLPSPNYMYPPAYGLQNRYLPKIGVSDFTSPLPSPIPDLVPRGITLGDSVDNLDTSPSRFSLPSPSKTHDFGGRRS